MNDTRPFPVEIPGINRTDIGSLLFVGTLKYYRLMVTQLLAGQCPFCQIDPAVNKVLYENQSWRVWINPVPGKANMALHLVIPCKRHITHINELNLYEGEELVEVFRWASNEFHLHGGGVMMRFGDPELNAGTIRHLHCNIQVPSGKGKLDITLAKDPDKIEWHRKVIVIFEKMRTGTPFDQLTTEEQNLVHDRLG